MEESQDPKSKLEQLESKKRELLDQIRDVNNKMRNCRDQIVKLVPSLRGKAWLRGEKTKSAVDSIEFEISTSAYTPAQERLMLKKLKKAQDDMDQALKLDGVRDKVDAARIEMDGYAKKHEEIDAALKTVRAELDTTYKQILESNAQAYQKMKERRTDERRGFQRTHVDRQRHERRKEEIDDLKPYMKQHDDFVSLEEIAEIKKKPAKEKAQE